MKVNTLTLIIFEVDYNVHSGMIGCSLCQKIYPPATLLLNLFNQQSFITIITFFGDFFRK